MIGESPNHRLSEVDYNRLLNRHDGTLKPRIEELSYIFPDFNETTKRVRKLLKTRVLSPEIMDILKSDSDLVDWVRQGITLHQDKNAERCLFCKQLLPEQYLDSLRARFNGEYKHLMQHINQEIRQLTLASENLEKIQTPTTGDFYDHLAQEFRSCKLELEEAKASAKKVFPS